MIARRRCGDGLANVNGGHIRGKGPLIIIFMSDAADTLQGFKFKWECECCVMPSSGWLLDSFCNSKRHYRMKKVFII